MIEKPDRTWVDWPNTNSAGLAFSCQARPPARRTEYVRADITAAEITALRERVKVLEAAMRAIHPYLTWTISSESPGYHPTMPSAIAAFKEVMGPDNYELRRAAKAMEGK